MRPLFWFMFLSLAASTGYPAKADGNSGGCEPSLLHIKNVIRKYNSDLYDEDRYAIDLQEGAEQMPYNDYFAPAIDGKTIEMLARWRRKNGQTSNVADFFGSAVFTRDPEYFDSLTGIRFKRSPLERRPFIYRDPPANWTEIEGNILNSIVWRDLDQNLKSRKIRNFDLVFIRPFAPLDNFWPIGPESKSESLARLSILHGFLNRVWRRTSEDEGVIYVQLNRDLYNNRFFVDWIETLKELGIDARIGPDGLSWNEYQILTLTRHRGSSRGLAALRGRESF